jgi:hypothetical protein
VDIIMLDLVIPVTVLVLPVLMEQLLVHVTLDILTLVVFVHNVLPNVQLVLV